MNGQGKKWVLSVVVLVSLIGSAGAANIDLPWFDGAAGNPYTDGTGNTWRYCSTTNGSDYNPANYVTMTWFSDWSMWNAYGQWSYAGAITNGIQMEGTNDSVTGYWTTLSLQPAANGTYSFYGTAANIINPSVLRVAVWDANTATGSMLFSSTIDGSLDLAGVTELQNIVLDTNDTLLIMSGFGGTAPAVHCYTQLIGAGLEVVPEPATMALLAVGGCALLRRRRA